jgi:hypothetical protein
VKLSTVQCQVCYQLIQQTLGDLNQLSQAEMLLLGLLLWYLVLYLDQMFHLLGW